MRLREVAVSTEDSIAVRLGMEKCSKWFRGHDKSKALDVNRPAPNEISDDIESLRAFMKQVKRSQSQTKEAHEKHYRPKSSAVG